MLRPLAESIEERLLSISSFGRSENGLTLDAVDRTDLSSRGGLTNADADIGSDGQTGEKISDVSSCRSIFSTAFKWPI